MLGWPVSEYWRTHNPLVEGSNPSGPTNKSKTYDKLQSTKKTPGKAGASFGGKNKGV
ncbi:hypothetical protein CCP4SC76_2580012 [Gammaproteobacteria bacterium]